MSAPHQARLNHPSHRCDSTPGTGALPSERTAGFSPDACAAAAGLYLHVPFCAHKCHYCDFYSIVEQSGPRHQAFTDALVRELRARAGAYDLMPETIFVGGGTPTLLPAAMWARLLNAMASLDLLANVREFTVEANPETVTPELMRTLVASGVNRISMGAQSFQPRLLKALERWHDPASVARAVTIVRDAGIANVNLDLIFAIPGQTMAELDADLDAALALEPTHLSCYSLIFEPHTPLTKRMALGLIKPMDEQTERAMYEHVMGRLDDAGFEQYEVSNWARRGGGAADHRCAHNLLYWRNDNWIGVGPSAASHMAGRRWKNRPHLGAYIAQSPDPTLAEDETLEPARQVGERLMLALRTREGIALAWVEQALAADDDRRDVIDELVAIDMLERTDTHLRVTNQGLFVADAIVARLL
ncbi:MAG: radical SAM family heme chaperone HemW [Phycisphaeraceae bacterium]